MCSMQRPKLAQQTSVDQVEFFYKFSIIVSKNKLFEGLKLNISKKFQCSSAKAKVYSVKLRKRLNL